MAIPGVGYTAAGNIRPCRFVKGNGDSHEVVECDTAGEFGLGIAQEALRAYPISGGTTYAGIDGDPIRVYLPGEIAFLEYGGTIQAGEEIQTAADGQGIAAAAEDYVLAIALEDGADGERHQVRVTAPYQKNA